MPQTMTERERFLALMEYQPLDRVPNHEVGVWQQTIDRWEAEGLNRHSFSWDWFTHCDAFDMDACEFIPTVHHLVSPDVSLDNFRHYMERKQALLEGRP